MNKTLTKLGYMLLFLMTLVFMVTEVQAKKRQSAKVPDTIEATGSHVFIFSPRSLTWTLYDPEGYLIRSGHAVGGQSYCPDIGRGCRTPSGYFRVYDKQGAYFKSSKYPLPRGGAPMPYAMFFHRDFAIHGSNSVPKRNASHGCIRVYNKDAKWLSSAMPMGTRVIVRPY